MISAKDLIRFTLIHALIFDHFKTIFSLKASGSVSLLLFFCFHFIGSGTSWITTDIFICEVYWTLLNCTIHFYKLIITWPIIYRISSWKTWVARILNRRHSIYNWVITIPTAVHRWYSCYHLELIPWLVCSSLLVTKALVETEFRLFHSAKDRWVALVYLKSALYLSANVFSKKVLIGDKFYVFAWRWHRHFTWSSEPHQVLAVCRAKEELSFLSYFKTLTIELCSQALYRLS